MIRQALFSKPRTVAGPRGHRAYAVGDIHGRLDLLERLLNGIEAEIAEHSRHKTSIIFLGDIIDRGPASAEVVERLRTYRHSDASVHFVMGNHEEVMLRVLGGEANLLASWLRFGGAETLTSYGVDPAELGHMRKEAKLERIRAAIPAEHRKFIEGFADSISFGGYLFVHAGIRPGIDLAEQSQTDLRWIREPFLEDSRDHGFVVVHGHTITNEVDVTPNRIGIDTGAFCTGTLTALGIDGSRRWLIQADVNGTDRLPLD